MRFRDVSKFTIEQLALDENNYRFGKAADQKNCIEKIHGNAEDSFGNIMSSIATDDLGEVLLVLTDAKTGEFVCMDGNRRLAALKVLQNPDLAPTAALKKQAEKLRPLLRKGYDEVIAQVSDDRQLVLKTIHERHASGKGVSRLEWGSLARARFSIKEEDEPGDWKSMVIVGELEKDSSSAAFIASKAFSYDTFRRVIRGAVKLRILDERLFSEKRTSFKPNLSSAKLKEALKVGQTALELIRTKQLTLSRKAPPETYADKRNVEAILRRQFLNSKTKGAKGKQKAAGKPKRYTYIARNDELITALNNGRLVKLAAFYDSLTSLPVSSHPILTWIGAWCFLDSLGAKFRSGNSGFDSLRAALNIVEPDRTRRKDVLAVLARAENDGNVNKHSGTLFNTDASQVIVDMEAIAPFLILVVQQIAAKKN